MINLESVILFFKFQIMSSEISNPIRISALPYDNVDQLVEMWENLDPEEFKQQFQGDIFKDSFGMDGRDAEPDKSFTTFLRRVRNINDAEKREVVMRSFIDIRDKIHQGERLTAENLKLCNEYRLYNLAGARIEGIEVPVKLEGDLGRRGVIQNVRLALGCDIVRVALVENLNSDVDVVFGDVYGDLKIDKARNVRVKGKVRGDFNAEEVGENLYVKEVEGYLNATKVGRNLYVEEVERDLYVGEVERDLYVGEVRKDLNATKVGRNLYVEEVERDLYVGEVERDLYVGEVERDLNARKVGGRLNVRGVERDLYVAEVEGDFDARKVRRDLYAGKVGGRFNAGEVGGDLNARKVGGRFNAGEVGGRFNAGEVEGDLNAREVGGNFEVGKAQKVNGLPFWFWKILHAVGLQ